MGCRMLWPMAMHDELDEVRSISDPRVPQWVREHARRFRQPVTWVEDLGDDEYALYAEDGELIDLCRLVPD